jgi:hypothetical protein
LIKLSTEPPQNHHGTAADGAPAAAAQQQPAIDWMMQQMSLIRVQVLPASVNIFEHIMLRPVVFLFESCVG